MPARVAWNPDSIAAMTAIAAAGTRRRAKAVGESGAKLPPIVPLFIIGFVVMVLLRTWVVLPGQPWAEVVLEVADIVQSALLAAALTGIGASLRLERIVRSGPRALAVGALSWLVILGLGLGAVLLVPVAV